ncbi:hypothetical protein [Alcaligenes sp. SDU_A2]|uniref:hypothetical protein n=1 Tax=Alcaligenes sp. SDU_A2 TaxID=3136634 RepID=UPI00311FFD65
MPITRTLGRAAGGALLLAALGGCATQVGNLPPALNPQVQPASVHLPAGAVVSIQFPMLVSPAAKAALQNDYPCRYIRFLDRPFAGCSGSEFSGDYAPLLFESSTYYSAELKTVLGRYLPEHAIRLEPQRVDYADGRFTTTPLLASTSPSVLVIELYDFPNAVRSAQGAGYAPTINLRTAGAQSPKTCGNLLVSAGHLTFKPLAENACIQADARRVGGFSPLSYFDAQPPELVDYPKQDKALHAPGQLLTLPMLWEKNKDDYIQASTADGFVVNARSIDNATSDWIARVSAHLLTQLDMQQAFQAGLVHYAADYDAGLAQRLAAQTLQAGDDRKITILNTLLNTENQWLAAENQAIAQGILNGRYGQSFRSTRLLLAQAYNKSQSLGWLQAGATLLAGFSSGLLGGVGAYNPSALMSQTLANESYFAARQDELGQTLLQELNPGVTLRDQVLEVNIEGLKQNISGESQSQIRSQLLAIYQKLARS